MFESAIEIFLIFLRLGLTSFGGPVAHLGYFHNEFVLKRKWFGEATFADLVALCQFLPGPASSQVGIAIGLSRGGIIGSLAAWLGFTLPSAALLVALAYGLSTYSQFLANGFLHGLKIAAVAIVAQAIWGMSQKLCPDKQRAAIAIHAAIAAVCFPVALAQIGVIVAGGFLGLLFIRQTIERPQSSLKTNVSTITGIVSILIFVILLFALPIVTAESHFQAVKLFDSFYRAGSLVFGGGHVVLPLLRAEVVTPGWVTPDAFMVGYGAAQAVPGPLFTFSAYLGAVSNIPPSGLLGGCICLVAAFLPSFLLVIGMLPFWERLRTYKQMRYAMLGINASVVGLLIAAFYNPVWSSAIFSAKDFALAAFCFLLLLRWKLPSWAAVLMSGCLGALWL